MRHRMIDSNIGLGNPSPELFNNIYTLHENINAAIRKFFDDVLDTVTEFKLIGGFDFSIDINYSDNSFTIRLGVEPAYKHDPYICYCMSSDMNESYIEKGVANGYYGSDIVISDKVYYRDSRFDKSFKKLIDLHLFHILKEIRNANATKNGGEKVYEFRREYQKCDRS